MEERAVRGAGERRADDEQDDDDRGGQTERARADQQGGVAGEVPSGDGREDDGQEQDQGEGDDHNGFLSGTGRARPMGWPGPVLGWFGQVLVRCFRAARAS